MATSNKKDLSPEEIRSLTRVPWGTRWGDAFSLLSPQTWQGAAKIGRIQWQWKKMFSYSIAAVTPACLYYGYSVALGDKPKSDRSVNQRIVTFGYSVWSLGWLWMGSIGIRTVAIRTVIWAGLLEVILGKPMRSRTNDGAWKCLAQRVSEQRAVRCRRYDLYLPPQEKTTNRAVFFLPGFGVDRAAYAEPLALLSDEGIVVVALSAEPLRVATPELGFDGPTLRRFQTEVEEKLGSPLSWGVMGHSLGSFTATHVAKDLDMPVVILWGSAPMVDLIVDMSLSNKKVLILQGEEDKVISFMVPNEEKRKEQTKAFFKKLPTDAAEQIIPGGNHKGFANYTSAFPLEDEADSGKQHAEAARLSADFLMKYTPSAQQ